MKHKLFYSLIAAAFLLTINISCQREAQGLLPVDTPKPAETVMASVAGRILDDKNVPVAGASVRTPTATATTDINGNFELNNIILDKDAGFVKVEKAGFFTGSRTFVVSTDARNYVEIELIPKTKVGSFETSSGGNITVASGGAIQFPSNAVVDEATKAAYSGNVSVEAFHLNPDAANFSSIMPGALRGVRTDNSEAALQSFGMMAVELTGAGGQKLQLATGKTASISFPIPSSLQAQAPQTIPLWYFDETSGLWKEEGSAVKQGNNYVGTVSHFSFWNCDAPFPVIDFKAVLKDENNNPYAYAKVVISISGNKTTVSASGHSNAQGEVSGKIPANKNLYIEIYNKCNSIIYSQPIGPFSSSTDLGTIRLTTNEKQTTVSGTVVDCNRNPVTNGFVNLLLNSRHYRATINNGLFSLAVTTCDAGPFPIRIVAYDIANNKQSDSAIHQLTVGTALNMGESTACSTTTGETITLTIGARQYAFVFPGDSITCLYGPNVNQTSIMAITRDGRQSLTLAFQGSAKGSVPLRAFKFYNGDSMYYQYGNSNVRVDEYGAVNELIIGSYTGTVQRNDSVQQTVNIYFRARRRQ